MDKVERRVMILLTSKINKHTLILGVVFRARWIDGIEVELVDELGVESLKAFVKKSRFYEELKVLAVQKELTQHLAPYLKSLDVKNLDEVDVVKRQQAQAILSGVERYLREKI